MRAHPLLPFAFAGALLAGCAVRPEADPQELAARDRAMVARIAGLRAGMARTVVERMGCEAAAARAGGAPASYDMLIISGGGEWGAFGAGFLNGWGRVPEGDALARPHFDAVTGISTGALIAPYVFLGDAESLRRVEGFYRRCRPEWVSAPSWLGTLFGAGPFWDSSGLEQVLAEAYEPGFIARIAAERERARMLLVASADLDLSRQAVWDLVEEAGRAAAAGPARFLALLRASIAIPGVFRPVELDGSLHADGGVIEQFFVATDPQQCWAVMSGWRRGHGDEPMPRVRFWVLINNQLRLAPATTQPGWMPSVTRAIQVMGRVPGIVGPLHDLWLYTQYLRQSGIDIEVRWTAIPDGFAIPDTGVAFDPAVTNVLADLGLRMGADPASWHTEAPTYFSASIPGPPQPGR